MPTQAPQTAQVSIRPMPTPPRLAILIVNYNSWPDSLRLVRSLAAEPEVAAGLVEVVLVDNASDGPIPPGWAHPPAGVRLVARAENGGFAAGVNTGRSETRADWLLLLNPDVEVEPGFLAGVLDRIDGYERRPGSRPALVGFALLNGDGSPQPSVGEFPTLRRTLVEQLRRRRDRKYRRSAGPGPVPWATGACLLVAARAFDDLGGMDADFFLYYEEVAFCQSAWLRGWSVEFDPTLAARHLRPLQQRTVSPRLRLVTRHSKLLYFRKFRPDWEFRSLAVAIVAEATIRGLSDRARGRVAAAGAWRGVVRASWSLLGQRPMVGTAVIELADEVMAAVEKRPTVDRPAIRRPYFDRGPAVRVAIDRGSR